MAAGLTQAAEAASYSYGLTYVDTWFSQVEIFFNDGRPKAEHASLRASEEPYGLPLSDPFLVVGQEYTFYLDYDGASISSCWLGPIDCTIALDGYWGTISFDPIRILSENLRLEFKGMALGSNVSLLDNDSYSGIYHSGDGWLAKAHDRVAYFTVTRELAPVPLPASAVLLSGALGGLALIRRRRISGDAGLPATQKR